MARRPKTKRPPKPVHSANRRMRQTRAHQGTIKLASLKRARNQRAVEERYLSKNPISRVERRKLPHAITSMQKGASLTKTASLLRIPPKRLRRILRSAKLIAKRKGRWKVRDAAPLQMPMFSKGKAIRIIPADAKNRSAVGKYLNAVRAFLRSNKPEKLAAFKGKAAIDVTGAAHPYEIDENTLYALNSAGSRTFEDFYTIRVFARE